ncbi:MAG: 4Fe-4S dicluster domain-containing protein [Candidatus Altiarchaeales archaeon]|nr:4Fe-4S dicluster domain-containing protein [Candidatus Altiarchaeales archaeon]
MNTYEIIYSTENSSEPVLSRVILETKALVNILKADIDQDKGVMVISISGSTEDAKRVIKAFSRYGVKIRKIEKKILLDRDKCIDCGACIGLCPVYALEFDKKKKLVLYEDKCIQCKACVKACPMKAFLIEE